MASAQNNDSFDINNFELRLREKINELQWKTESLEENQKDLLETRRSLYEVQTHLEDERRISQQLQIQLKTALESAKFYENENIKNQTQHIRMRLKCETSAVERDVLIDEARRVRYENMDFKVKIQELERNMVNMKVVNETLEASLVDLRNNVTRLHTRVHSNIGKLEREQEKLRESFGASVKFGQYIQAMLKTSYVAHQRDKKTIEELKKKINTLDTSRSKLKLMHSIGEHTDIGTLQLQLENTLKELRCKISNNSIEDKLSIICNELQKMDGSFTKD